MSVLEKEIEAKLRDGVKARGGWCLKWVCPGWAGIPDRIVLMPGGRVFFVETKRPKGGVLSKRQEKWRDIILGLGMRYSVIWNKDDIQQFFNTELWFYESLEK